MVAVRSGDRRPALAFVSGLKQDVAPMYRCWARAGRRAGARSTGTGSDFGRRMTVRRVRPGVHDAQIPCDDRLRPRSPSCHRRGHVGRVGKRLDVPRFSRTSYHCDRRSSGPAAWATPPDCPAARADVIGEMVRYGDVVELRPWRNPDRSTSSRRWSRPCPRHPPGSCAADRWTRSTGRGVTCSTSICRNVRPPSRDRRDDVCRVHAVRVLGSAVSFM